MFKPMFKHHVGLPGEEMELSDILRWRPSVRPTSLPLSWLVFCLHSLLPASPSFSRLRRSFLSVYLMLYRIGLFTHFHVYRKLARNTGLLPPV